MNYNKVSQNSLEESDALLGKLKSLIERDFLHVNECGNIPQILKAIKAEMVLVDAELEKRYREDDEDDGHSENVSWQQMYSN